jgi:5-methyltetrahydrofolate--homocysteine methyltransferase
MPESPKTLRNLMAELDETQLLEEVKRQLDTQINSPSDILNECREGIQIVGERFAKGEYFLSDLMMSGEMLKNVIEELGPHLAGGITSESAGKVVFGTVKGDIHNIGKDIVISLLRADGLEVFDLGIDVPAENFVDKVKETGASIVGLSCLITPSYDSMKDTIQALTKAGLRGQVKVMIGGGLINQEVCDYTGADAWGDNAFTAVQLCRTFLTGAK